MTAGLTLTGGGAVAAVPSGGLSIGTVSAGGLALTTGSAALTTSGFKNLISDGRDLISNIKSGSGKSKTSNPTNIKMAKDNYLKQNGIDAHEVKQDVVGKKNIAQYDIYIDKDTGQLWVYRKGGKGEGIPTGEYIK
ncbi:polymorphic toxin type 33 domain-containing protein [Listeria cornellensis]|uniref:MafB-related protein n=1 Tax=Listeria cornellensis FSL F6-0969 TaxID=1265820 RepID=W7BIJ6_9LIST|nr:polymorphic toxin type 33 domain-containing protein [Listeria cornellensis]EUJ26914.1 MafB-related protein [Listeria cornellensis FSL F6-0969]